MTIEDIDKAVKTLQDEISILDTEVASNRRLDAIGHMKIANRQREAIRDIGNLLQKKSHILLDRLKNELSAAAPATVVLNGSYTSDALRMIADSLDSGNSIVANPKPADTTTD